ncbi:3-dehydroquinate synthase [Haloferula luteola]|uniref:3-dehydroquinate synthase n=1 Tax=Haloferula luteola TaxID=595692 RepID=A0A840VAM6_9BACT|nr:3-dehydroquinate synthase [Haloferula luteola]MBB5352604.1 3-dehydroquinate synthase [Haloferula luteola]
MPTTHVPLPGREYDILVEPGILSSCGTLIQGLGLRSRCALITDEKVAAFHADTTHDSLESAGFQVSRHVIPSGEASKSFACFAQLCEEMAAAGHDRASFIVALGGGVVGDLAGFVAASYFRGIPFIQIPTTIVAQVDSSVGGKTGINLKQGKNLVGAFHQPVRVLIDPHTLRTLPGREFREGFAEVIKHAAIRDAAMLDELADIDPHSPDVPTDLIARNVAIKAAIVIEDEKETTGTRALLNFGHTIGHGIEAAVPYGEMLHGEAISLGIRAALFLSEKHAQLAPQVSRKILALLERFQLPLTLPESISTATVMEKLSKDKKFDTGRIRFVLLRRAGDAFVSDQITPTDLEEAIEVLRGSGS